MSPRTAWTPELIEAELTGLIAQLGRMPTRAQLNDMGQGKLWDAMRRHGGVAMWKQKLTVQASVAPDASSGERSASAATPKFEDVQLHAYFIYERGQGGDHLSHWFEAERGLSVATI